MNAVEFDQPIFDGTHFKIEMVNNSKILAVCISWNNKSRL